MKFKDYIVKMYFTDCSLLAEAFVKHYFGEAGNIDQWWIASDVGGVYSVNDYFFDMREMVDFLKHKYTRKEMFEYKNQQLECYESKNRTMLCIRDWKKINKMKLK